MSVVFEGSAFASRPAGAHSVDLWEAPAEVTSPSVAFRGIRNLEFVTTCNAAVMVVSKGDVEHICSVQLPDKWLAFCHGVLHAKYPTCRMYPLLLLL
jgi:hypothetical protein